MTELKLCPLCSGFEKANCFRLDNNKFNEIVFRKESK